MYYCKYMQNMCDMCRSEDNYVALAPAFHWPVGFLDKWFYLLSYLTSPKFEPLHP